MKITFQEALVESDEIGNRTNTWKDYYTCHATVRGENGSEQNTAGQTVEDGKVDFTIRYCKKGSRDKFNRIQDFISGGDL